MNLLQWRSIRFRVDADLLIRGVKFFIIRPSAYTVLRKFMSMFSSTQWSQLASPSGFGYGRADLGFFSYGQAWPR